MTFDDYISTGLGIFKEVQAPKVAAQNAKAAQANATLQTKLAEIAKNKTLMLGIGAAVLIGVFFLFRKK